MSLAEPEGEEEGQEDKEDGKNDADADAGFIAWGKAGGGGMSGAGSGGRTMRRLLVREKRLLGYNQGREGERADFLRIFCGGEGTGWEMWKFEYSQLVRE